MVFTSDILYRVSYTSCLVLQETAFLLCRSCFCNYFGRVKIIRFIQLFFLGLIPVLSSAQSPDINFHFVTTKDGLNDNYINNIAQDKYGYMWFTSLGGLNRYNGKTVRRFTNIPGDSSSLPSGIAWSMANDAEGRLRAGFDFGLF